MENNNQEVWVEMFDFPTYEVSNLGNVRNAKTKKQMKVRQDGKEYRMVSLWKEGKGYTKRVGRYVWMSHNNQFCRATIDHINKDAGDDRIENLRCIPLEQQYLNLKDRKKVNKYNLTPEIKGYIHRSIKDGSETTWTIMKKYGIPLNYTMTVMKRNSWERYA